jgi:hypothetical protein
MHMKHEHTDVKHTGSLLPFSFEVCTLDDIIRQLESDGLSINKELVTITLEEQKHVLKYGEEYSVHDAALYSIEGVHDSTPVTIELHRDEKRIKIIVDAANTGTAEKYYHTIKALYKSNYRGPQLLDVEDTEN